MNRFDAPIVLSPDMADFLGINAKTTFQEFSTRINLYVAEKGLASGPLPLPPSASGDESHYYARPEAPVMIMFDECLNYLFSAYFAEMGITPARPVPYSVFKGLCLKHVTLALRKGHH